MIAKEVRPESINPVSGVKVVAAEVGDDAPQWRKDLARDGVSGGAPYLPLFLQAGSGQKGRAQPAGPRLPAHQDTAERSGPW